MEPIEPHIRFKLDTDKPIVLSEFLGSFVGLNSQFEKFVAVKYPNIRGEAEVFVKDVRDGCVVADLIVMFGTYAMANQLPGVMDFIDKGQILSEFVAHVKERISPYLNGMKDPRANKSDLSDFLKATAAIARDPDSSATLEAAEFVDGTRDVRVRMKFDSGEAKKAQRAIKAHREELEAKTDADHSRVLLQFVRPSAEAGKPGKPGGERGVILSFTGKPCLCFTLPTWQNNAFVTK